MIATSLLLALLPIGAPRAVQETGPFPVATAESQNLDPKALAALADVVRGFVEHDEVVGAELLVIRGGRTVLHEAFGWKDREQKAPMVRDTIFCVRSMTKPVVGTAVEMLIEAGKLKLDDKVARYLPSFDNDKSRAITIEQLLHHTSGLPLSSLLAADASKLTSIRQVADMAGAHGAEFTPGERFSYSDDGADTLGALVEIASGKPLAEFLAERVFAPLGMHDTLTMVAKDEPLRARLASDYLGGAGAWSRFWSPADPPLFPIFLASQGLYSTPRDYARFLELWKERGKPGEQRLLRASTCKRALAPGTSMGTPSGFEGVGVDYGELWIVYVDRQQKPGGEPYGFGHSGSDGTFSYVFPALDLMVLYFTQARGTTTGDRFEAVLQRELVDPLLHVDRKPAATYSAAELDALVGLYWDERNADVLAVARKGVGLELEVPGRAALELKPTSTRERWILALSPDDSFTADRAEDGSVRALVGANPKAPAPVRFERWKPAAGLPTLDELMALRKRAVDWDLIPGLGAMQVKGTIEMPTLKRSGTFTSLSQGLDRYRLDLALNTGTAQIVRDGDRAWTANSQVSGGKPTPADAAAVARLRLASPLHVIADWRALFAELRVLGRTPFGEKTAIVVRAEPPTGRARTFLVDAESGLLLAERVLQADSGLGEIGLTIYYDDWRPVSGIRLPFANTAENVSPLLGAYETRWTSCEAHAEVPAEAFAMK